jgi:hypothetical protein
MAVTNLSSTQFLKNTDPRTNSLLVPQEYQAELDVSIFDFTQTGGAGDSGSTVNLAKLPSGRAVFLPKLSFIQWSAMGGTGAMAIGYRGYNDENDTAVVAAASAFDTGVSTVSAGGAAMGASVAAGTGGRFTFLSKSTRLGNIITDPTAFGVTLFATITGGAGCLPNAATLTGYIVYALLGTG